MMISGTAIVWYGTQDSTIMDGKPTSELDIIIYKREIDDMLSTVIAPAEYCAESKSQRAEGQQGSAYVWNFAEGLGGEFSSVFKGYVREGKYAADYHYPGDCANHNCVPKCAGA